MVIPGGMDGIRQKYSDLKVIVSSAYSIDPIMVEYKKYGFNGRLSKPYQIAELKQVLSKVAKQFIIE